MFDRSLTRALLALALLLLAPAVAAAKPVHVWEKHELTFTATRDVANPYTDVTVWVDLNGPGFHKRVYGFWDGGRTYRVRLLATAAGKWSWRSGATPASLGISGKSGSFTAIDWTEAEKQANPLRRGMIESTPNHHALQFPDGTPFFIVGDTWYAAGTNRFPWSDDNVERPIGPAAGFKDYLRYRKAQGYNWISIIAAFPNWDNDGLPWHIVRPDGATVRTAWLEFGTGPNNREGTAKNMKNEGGRPFLFPGKVPGYENVFPDMDRINPAYFQALDRKIDYLNSQGFVPFIEAFRRDASELWRKYYRWPDSCARYIQYVWSRYQANIAVLSPVHLDIIDESVSVPEFKQAINMVESRYGAPPFGSLLSANSNPSTFTNWGDPSWVTLQSIGNKREHEYYWYLTQIYRSPDPKPAYNGEPYYAGYFDARGLNGGYKYGAKGGTDLDAEYVRSSMYGSVLSGGLGGHVYGAEGIWGADIEPAAPTHMWDAFQWQSGADMTFLPKFVMSIGKKYQELVPDAWVVPSRTPVTKGYQGWAYAARTPDQKDFLAYFEADAVQPALIRGAIPNVRYRARWFDPRTGGWSDAGEVDADVIGEIHLPPLPDGRDWALSLMAR